MRCDNNCDLSGSGNSLSFRDRESRNEMALRESFLFLGSQPTTMRFSEKGKLAIKVFHATIPTPPKKRAEFFPVITQSELS